MMLVVAEARRAQVDTQVDVSTYSDVTGDAAGGFSRVAERVNDMMNNPSLQEAAEQVAVLCDVDGGDAFADELIWDVVEVLMQNPIFKVEARRLAINFATAMADPEFAQQLQKLSALITEEPEHGQLFKTLAEAGASHEDSSRTPKKIMSMLLLALAAPASAFNIPMHAPKVRQQEAQRIPRVHMQDIFDPLRIKGFGPQPLKKFVPSLIKTIPTPNAAAAALTAAAVALHAEAAHAKSVLGVNGALDFGPLAGDQPGGEGTGKALGINDDSLGFILFGGVFVVGLAWSQWQSYQDDDEDFFDTYDSRRFDKEA